jgi:protein-tyrosine phosphatase
MTDHELANAHEFIKDRLYFTSIRAPPKKSAEYHFFNVDNELVYEPFFDDFGPVNMAMLYRFCCHLADKLRDRALENKKIVYYTSHDAQKRANGAFLISSFAIIHLKQSAEEAYRPLVGAYPPFAPFKDVYGGSWNCTIIDTCRAVDKAQQLGWLNFETFNVQQYEYYERVENGDLNEIIPGRFVAFSGPAARRTEISLGPEDYIPILKRFNVTAVVRLNKKVYDRKKFLDAGIKHYDMYFIDGGNPTDAIIQQYLEVVENERGAIGIHCKAGLGRTGVLNACYLMKHYRMSANELIAWMRICRPGTVIGPQQQFLKEVEPKMWREGDLWRKHNGDQPPLAGEGIPPLPKGWFEQGDARCDQDEDFVAELESQGIAVGGPARAAATQAAAPARYVPSSSYGTYQRAYSGGASAARVVAPAASSSYGAARQPAAVREAPTRTSAYGTSHTSRSGIGASAYASGAKASGSAARGYGGSSYGSSAARSSGTRYY